MKLCSDNMSQKRTVNCDGEGMDALVSIVLPIYNVEPYLDRCVESITNQTYRNLEILLIDDGSPDACPQMCDTWAEKDNRIRVIHKPNAGLGMARNTGIECATGEYICFFDSDDYVEHNTIELAVELAKKEQADIVLYGASIVDAHGKVVQSLVPESEKVCYRGAEVLNDLLPSILQSDLPTPKTRNLTLSAWSCLYSMQMIRESAWRFVSERTIISEDVYSLLDLYRNVHAAAIVTQPLYYYCRNSSSLTQSYRPDRFVMNKLFFQACVELCEHHRYPAAVKKGCMSPFLGNAIASMKQEVANYAGARMSVRELRKIIEDPLLQSVVKEKKDDLLSRQVRLLFWAIEHKHSGLCYLLIKAKGKLER